MCGICGIYDFQNPVTKWNDALARGVQLLKRRGPNCDGIYTHNHAGLAHTRLAVIDTSEIANQPFTDKTGRYTIVYNGEFYNYKEQRKKLEEKGYVFRSQSDTEVLLNLFIELGISFLNEVNGCFSLAVYDNIEESLFVARDRLGIKPLVYYYDGNKFIFSSELKAILPFGINKNIDQDSLRLYFCLNYIPAPHSIFHNVYKLLPGHYIKVKKEKIETIRYYNIPGYELSKSDISFDEATQHIRNLLEESVKRRLVSDVPLGTFLSGGLDSSIVTALASNQLRGLNTFSAGFSDDPFYDETDSAKLIAEKFQTNHTVFSLSRKDLFDHLTDVLDYLDEPFADSSSVAVSILSKLTKNHVTVALSGDGADELHAGYNKHYAHYRALQNSSFNFFARNSEWFWSSMPKSRNSKISNKSRQALRYSKGLRLTDKERYWYWSSFASENYIDKLFTQNASPDFTLNRNTLIENINKDFNSILYTDMLMVLPNDMLHKVDMMSMSHGLEVRVPMLDHTIVDFMFTLPGDYKIDSNQRKKLLRNSFKNILPREILSKPKHGFEIPLLPWLKTGLQPLLKSTLNKSDISNMGLFNYKEIEKLNHKLLGVNPSESATHLWTLFVFQYWCNKYLH